jgi:hypothetical protein
MIDRVYNVTFLVLLYKNEIATSTTLNTLLKSGFKFHNCKIVIWNNGPHNLNSKNTNAFTDMGLDVDVQETINNESLAKIYNDLFRLVRSNKYVILDDDSTLNLSYLQAALNATKYELCVPIITNKSNIKGPKCNEIIVEHTKEFEVDEQLKAIGSGMVIGNKVVSDITDIYGATFDERFYLYGVDFTFCYRVNQIGTIDIRVIQGFEHSLSRLLNETALVTKFRLKERSYDSGLQLRYYFPWWKSSYSVIAIVVQHLWKKINKKKTSIIFMDFFRALIKGKHYRDNNG